MEPAHDTNTLHWLRAQMTGHSKDNIMWVQWCASVSEVRNTECDALRLMAQGDCSWDDHNCPFTENLLRIANPTYETTLTLRQHQSDPNLHLSWHLCHLWCPPAVPPSWHPPTWWDQEHSKHQCTRSCGLITCLAGSIFATRQSLLRIFLLELSSTVIA